MYSVRKILAVILALAMVFAMSASVFAAKSFPDLEGHWSKTYMEDLYNRGLLTGYPDGTMGPEKLITGAEALTFLAKLYTTNKTEDEAIHGDFGKTVDSVTSTAWVKSFLEKALAADIVSASELKAMKLFEPLPKEQLAMFIVRAIKMEEDAALLEDTELTFADVDKISEECYGSVALLTKLEITVGDNNNNWGPDGDVTRAVAATMVSKILTYVEKNKTDLTIEGYSGLSFAEGLLASVSKKNISLRDENGICYVYELAPDFGASINGSSKTTSIGTSLIGNPVELRLMNGYASLATITTEKDVTYSLAKFVQAVNKSSQFKAYDYYTDTTLNCDSMQAKITLNGETAAFSALQKNDYLKLTFTDKVLTGVDAVRGSVEIEGDVVAIAYGGIVNITVETQDGDVLLPLNISDLPPITRGERESNISKLVVGDGVKVTYTGGEIAKIAIDGTTATAEGSIVRITLDADSTKWFIEDEDGTTSSYVLAKNAIAYNGKKTIQTSALGVGDEVSLVVFDGEITEVELIKAHSETAAAAVKMSVKVINVDAKEKELAVLTEDGSLLYVECTYNTSILVTATGKTIQLSAIVPDEELIIYGSYDADGMFLASSIIIEDKQ